MTTPESDKAPATERPKAVTVGVVLWGLNALSYLGSVLVLLFARDSLVNAAVKANTKLTHDEAVTAANGQLWTYVVLFVLFGALSVYFGYKLWTERRWARIGLIVLAVVELLVTALLGSSIFTLVGTLFGLIGLIALFTPQVSAYFTALKQAA